MDDFSPHPIYRIQVKALDIHAVKCEISDNMVDAIIKLVKKFSIQTKIT